ncbi:MAG TPA: LamG domain-containing protein [Bacteroidales bacterium]|nr:LamG domain-containing protein [Bacteroidales bacterium]
MKKLLLFIFLICFSTIVAGQTGVGWGQQRSKVNFKDSINIAKGWMIDGVVVLPSVAEINYLDGVTAAIQGQINSKLAINDSIGGSAGNDFYATPTEVSSQIGDSITQRLLEGTLGVAVIDVLDGGGNDYFMSPDQVEGWFSTHSSGPFDRLQFTIGVTTGAPTVADSLLEDTKLRGKFNKVFRSGTYETQHYATVNPRIGFWQLGDSIIVNPVWQANEQVIVEIYDPIAWNNVSLEGQESDLLDSLAVYYKLDETSGTTLDDAEDNQDAIAGANTTATSLNAKYNYARHIGYKSQLRIPYNAAINPSGVFSVSMWIYADSIGTSSGDYLFSIINSGTYTNPHRVYIDTDGKILFKVRNSVGAEFGSISTVALNDSTKYHVVCAFRGDTKTCTIYIDGVDRTTSTGGLTYTFTGTLYPTNGSMYFGNSTTNGVANFRGTMDDCGLWYKILRQANATDLFNSAVTHPFE